MGRLEGQVALVTGGGQGVGRAAALGLAAEGASVVIAARRAAPLREVAAEIRALGVEALEVAGDVTDTGAVAALFAATQERFGRLDILMNNVGGNLAPGRITEVALKDWNANLDLNITAPFLCTQAALPLMREQRRGTIVNVASGAGRRPTVQTGSSYSSAKAALIMFNRFVNMEERQHGVRSTVIVLGTTDTPAQHRGPTPPRPEAQATWMQPEDIAQVVVMIATLPHRATVEEIEIRPTDPGYILPGWRYLGAEPV